MTLDELSRGQQTGAIALYTRVFGASEGEDEGAVIGDLVTQMFATTASTDLHAFAAAESGRLVACIIFSRIWLPSAREAFILSPVAVETQCQGTGYGQQLIRYGLVQLAERGAELAFTYGDPAYYAKVGFAPIEESVIAAPQPLSHPHGWLAQVLSGAPIAAESGAARCVPALDKPHYW